MLQVEEIQSLLARIATTANRIKSASGDVAYIDLRYDAASLTPTECSRRLRRLDDSQLGKEKCIFREAVFDLIRLYVNSKEDIRQVVRDIYSQDADIIIAYSYMSEEMRWLVVTQGDTDLFRNLMIGYSVLDLGDSRGHHLFLEAAGIVERGLAANIRVAAIAYEVAQMSSDRIRHEDFAKVSTRSFFFNCPLIWS